MAETLRDMVVSLSLNSDNFSANLRSINQQLSVRLCNRVIV